MREHVTQLTHQLRHIHFDIGIDERRRVRVDRRVIDHTAHIMNAVCFCQSSNVVIPLRCFDLDQYGAYNK